MNDSEIKALCNVLVMVAVDGQVTDAERELVSGMRSKLGIDGAEFRGLCEQVKAGQTTLAIPRVGVEAEKMLRLLVNAAMVDGEMAPAEQRLLEKVAAVIERDPSEVEVIVQGVSAGEADGALAAKIGADIEEIYLHFVEWTPDEQRRRCEAIGRLGSVSAIPLLRVLESYRRPEGGDGLDLKVLIVDQLAAIGDDRVVYYLAQQVSLSDADDEVTNAALRSASAAAIGVIVGKPFNRDAAGVDACRKWWVSKGTAEYRTLVL